MTLSFPLQHADFWDLLPISTITLECPPQVETSGTGAGQILTREVAPQLWRGQLTLGRLTPAEAGDILPLIEMGSAPGASFMAHDLMRPYPLLDPEGTVLGAAAVTVNDIGGSLRDLRLAGLPANYPLRRGDLIGLNWGASPTRYGLHRIVIAASADAGGLTGWIEVSPAVHSGVIVGGPVVLARPGFKAVITPGSVTSGTLRRGLVEGLGFSFSQSLR